MNPMEPKIRVLIVEDHPDLRQAVYEMIIRQADMSVVATAVSAEAALALIDGDAPDLVLTDISLPGMNGIELVRILQQRYPDILPVMLTSYQEKRYVLQALEAGARGYILKAYATEAPAAIRRVRRGEQYLSAAIGGLD